VMFFSNNKEHKKEMHTRFWSITLSAGLTKICPRLNLWHPSKFVRDHSHE
jgi:hypothetical protein